VLILWLTVIFISFGLCAPFNATQSVRLRAVGVRRNSLDPGDVQTLPVLSVCQASRPIVWNFVFFILDQFEFLSDFGFRASVFFTVRPSTFPRCPDRLIHIFIINRVINFAGNTNLVTDGNPGRGQPKGKVYAVGIYDSVNGT
jgi:hypothetical protein